ncbi:MAG: pyridoxal-phosphate dependent enzyme [Promethearchaeota archaeon]
MKYSVQWKNPPVCSQCNTSHDLPELWCKKCKGINTIQAIKGRSRSVMHPSALWDFSDFFPAFSHHITLQEGLTPVVSIKNIQDLLGLKMKLEFRNPTGSFRDRAAALILSDAIARKKSNMITVSTGSFSISMAAYAACSGIKSTSIVPENIELSKIEQMKLYGSEVIFKGDTLEKALDEAQKHIQRLKGTSKSQYSQYYEPTPNNNILLIEGQKSIGLEIALKYPEIENIIIPRGSGTLLYSIYRGLEDAQKSGWIENIPHLYAVALKKTVDSHLAESLDISDSRWMELISAVVKETEGTEMNISGGRMIKEALTIAKQEGLLIEPSSASVIVAARELREEKSIDLEKSMAILTGSGMNAMNIFATQLRMKKVVWGLSPTTAKFEILRLIAERKAHHGYGLWLTMGKKHTVQSIYQHLYKLEEENLIQNEKPKGKRASFQLTEKGMEIYVKMMEIIDL